MLIHISRGSSQSCPTILQAISTYCKLGHNASFQILPNSSFTNHPFIRCNITKATDSVLQ